MLDSLLLSGKRVAISISSSPDYDYLGVSENHISNAMVEIARYLMASGAHLIYGGDLRASGFTEVLFEVAARHHSISGEGTPAFTNYLPWAVHIVKNPTELLAIRDAVSGFGRLVLLTRDGKKEISFEERMGLDQADNVSAEDWALSLTSMRKFVTKRSDARILLGGQISGYKGTMPGVAEEALLSIKAKKPVFIVGGFGGCSADIARALRISEFELLPRREWPGIDKFEAGLEVGCGLNREQKAHLASSPYLEVILPYLLTGLSRIELSKPMSRSRKKGK